MTKPYSDLEYQVIAILSSGGDPLQSQNEAVAKYWRWRISPTADSHDLDPQSIRSVGRKLDDIYIKPFSVEFPANLFAKVTISQRSRGFYRDHLVELGARETIDETDQAVKLGDFRPAKVYARTGEGATAEPRTSRITGRSYKTYYARSDQGYSAPFGDKGAGLDYFDRAGEVEAAIKAINTVSDFVTITPEKYNP